MIVCRTLGPIEVTVDGAMAPGDLLWRKPLALMIYLARSDRRGRTREHLSSLLWPDTPDAGARHSLNEALRTLRRYGGKSAVEAVGDSFACGRRWCGSTWTSWRRSRAAASGAPPPRW